MACKGAAASEHSMFFLRHHRDETAYWLQIHQCLDQDHYIRLLYRK
jgi:hypothetical protein